MDNPDARYQFDTTNPEKREINKPEPKFQEKYPWHSVPPEPERPRLPHEILYEILGIDKDPDNETVDKVKFIYKELKEDRKKKIRKLFQQLGQVGVGKRKVDQLFQYLRLKKQSREILEESKKITKEIDSFKQ